MPSLSLESRTAHYTTLGPERSPESQQRASVSGGMIGLVLVREAYPGPPTVKGDVSRGSGNSKEGPFWFNASGVSRSILIAMAQPEPLFGPVLNGAFEGCTGQPR